MGDVHLDACLARAEIEIGVRRRAEHIADDEDDDWVVLRLVEDLVDVELHRFSVELLDGATELRFELFMRALAVAEKLLKPGGAFVGKIFMGEDFPLAKKGVKRVFDEERALRPEGVRQTSYELFLVGLGKKTVIPPSA